MDGNKDSFIICPLCKTSHVAFKPRQNGVMATSCQNCGHFFKYRIQAPYKSTITFTVNGKSCTVGNEFSPSASLNHYLRHTGLSHGTKVFCRQGGCGICIVTAKMPLNPQADPVTANINSSTQSLWFSKLRDGSRLTQKYPKLTKKMVEDHFEGNLCRCTGYRSILDAMKSLVPSETPDIEDLKICESSGKPCTSSTPGSDCSGHCASPTVPTALQVVFGDARWIKPTTVQDLQTALADTTGQKVRIMGANTGTGYFEEESLDNYDVAIDISGIPDMYTNTYDSGTGTYTIGACLSLSDLLDIFEAKAATSDCFNELKKYLYRVASSPVRNRGTWSGNLMLKNKYHSFPSDVFNIFTVLQATLYIGPEEADGVSVETFWNTDMTGKVLYKATFHDFGPKDHVACFKVMPRSQDSLALINGAFRCTVSNDGNFTVSGQPIISIGGVRETFHRAAATETYLVGKSLSNTTHFSGAVSALNKEVSPPSRDFRTGIDYKKCVSCGIFYKFILKILGQEALSSYQSAPTVLHDIRPLSSGEQTYDTKKQMWPLNEPLKKLEANLQCTGEATYVDDIPQYPDQLYGAFVTSTVANATIQIIDSKDAMKVPGVVRVLTVSDLPEGAVNNVMCPNGFPFAEHEEVLCSGKVMYYGQSVAFVVADSQQTADKAAKMVKVTYTNQQPPVVNIDDGIAAKAFFPKAVGEVVVGDPDQALSSAPHTLSGTIHLPEQIHMSLETQATNCRPTEDGLALDTTTQWTDGTQQAVSLVTCVQKSRIDVSVKRLGGGYGGKISRNNIVAAACGLAAKLLNKPVRARLDIKTQLTLQGRRYQRRADYKVGYDDTGKLIVLDLMMYEGEGYLPNEINLPIAYGYVDSTYYIPNWRIDAEAVKLNLAQATSVRAPGSTPTVITMEHILDRVARSLDLDPIDVKQLNFYTTGQTTPMGMPLHYCNIQAVYDQLMDTAQVKLRQESFKFYNQDNRWKKKALAVVPIKFGMSWTMNMFTALVSVYYEDGTVAVTHGGVEMGQGINTKVAQVVAYELGIPVDLVAVKTTNSVVAANNFLTGQSITSEACAEAAIECCKAINSRMNPIKASMPAGYTWVDLVKKCRAENVVLTESYTNAGTPFSQGGAGFQYNAYGATCAEVELDALTGEYQINRVDMVYDCGESLNPAVDIGQLEGGFMMGLGLNTTEEVKYDPTTGQMINFDTWTYHLPTNKDIPIDFRVALLKNAPNPLGVLRSKASGEPPLNMACAVFFALRKCVEEARKDVHEVGEFTFEPPATVEYIQRACLTDYTQFAIK